MKQAVKKAAENNLDIYQQMKSVSHAYSSQRECSVQESVYHIMAEFWLRKIFPDVIYANNNLTAKCLKIILSGKEIAELPNKSTDLHERTMIDCYFDKTSLEIIEHLCFVAFLKRYQIVPKAEENDFQTEE